MISDEPTFAEVLPTCIRSSAPVTSTSWNEGYKQSKPLDGCQVVDGVRLFFAPLFRMRLRRNCLSDLGCIRSGCGPRCGHRGSLDPLLQQLCWSLATVVSLKMNRVECSYVVCTSNSLPSILCSSQHFRGEMSHKYRIGELQ